MRVPNLDVKYRYSQSLQEALVGMDNHNYPFHSPHHLLHQLLT